MISDLDTSKTYKSDHAKSNKRNYGDELRSNNMEPNLQNDSKCLHSYNLEQHEENNTTNSNNKCTESRKMHRKMHKKSLRESSSNGKRRSYTVIMREALEKFKGKKRSRKYVLNHDQSDTTIVNKVAETLCKTDFVNQYHSEEDIAKLGNNIIYSSKVASFSSVDNSDKENKINNILKNPVGISCNFKRHGYDIYQPCTHIHNNQCLRSQNEAACYQIDAKLPCSITNVNENLKYITGITGTGNGNDTFSHLTNQAIKQRNQIKKYFTSPLHKRKLETKQNVQQTYVSFQDDFSTEIFPDFPSIHEQQDGDGKLICSNQSDFSSPLSVDLSPNDDVFVESKHLIANKVRKQNSKERYNERTDTNYPPSNNFNFRVNTNMNNQKSYKSKNVPNFHEKPHRRLHSWKTEKNASFFNNIGVKETKCIVPSCNNMVQVVQPDGMEHIMTTANLHASLDNALGILDETTKLLNHDSNPQTAPNISTRQYNNTEGLMGLNFFFPANRPRTYSTCSRLETIAEEIDRTDDTVALTSNYPATLENTIQDVQLYKSHYDIANDYNLIPALNRIETSSSYNSEISTPKSLPSSSGMYTTSNVSNNVTCEHTSYNIPVKPKDRDLYGTAERTRNYSTSTISVKHLSMQRNHEENILTNNFGNKQSGDKCTACEWLRIYRPQYGYNAVIPSFAWGNIINDLAQNPCGHYHPWGLCSNLNCPPTLCHSHYLQYYQYLQRFDYEKIRKNRATNSFSSQADSLIDYDINEVLSSLEEIISSSDTSLPIVQNRFHRPRRVSKQRNATINAIVPDYDQSLPMKHISEQKQCSDTASINSDSAFSTNGSPTPSTRDGVNTDHDSIDSIHFGEPEFNKQKLQEMKEQPQLPSFQITKSDKTIEKVEETEFSYGKRTYLKEEQHCNNNRYSFISSEDSVCSPPNYDNMRDSAVYLQDMSSSQSHVTYLSSESFSSNNTWNHEKTKNFGTQTRKYSIESSSEESLVSLNSECTLCLSDIDNFVHNKLLSTESIFGNVQCKHTKSTHTSNLQNNSSEVGKSGPSNVDTLTSSSGSDTNTLSSGSSGRSYLTNRSSTSPSIYNTLDSSSYVSTDDTGDTIIYQDNKSSSPNVKYQPSMFHYQNLSIPNNHADEKVEICTSKLDNAVTEKYKPLNAISENSSNFDNLKKKKLLRNSYCSLSLSCIFTSSSRRCYTEKSNSSPELYSYENEHTDIQIESTFTDYNKNFVKKRCVTFSKNELGLLGLNHINESTHVNLCRTNDNLTEKVNLMLSNCERVSNMLHSLKNLLQSDLIERSHAENKISELEQILKEKDDIINEMYNTLTMSNNTSQP